MDTIPLPSARRRWRPLRDALAPGHTALKPAPQETRHRPAPENLAAICKTVVCGLTSSLSGSPACAYFQAKPTGGESGWRGSLSLGDTNESANP